MALRRAATAGWSPSVVATVKLASAGLIASPGGAVYGISVASTSPTSPDGRLTRIDLTSGSVERGSELPSASQLLVVASQVLALEPTGERPDGAPIGPWVLYRAGRATADLTRVGTLGGVDTSGSPVVATGQAVEGTTETWIGDGSEIFEVNAADGAVTGRSRVGRVTSLSISPGGRTLYIGIDRLLTDPDADPTAQVVEMHAATGARVATTGVQNADVGAQVDAVSDGVWVTYRTGMAGTAERLGAARLRELGGLPRQAVRILSAGGPIEQGPAEVTLADHLWLSSPVGLACLEPATGRFEGGAETPVVAGSPESWQPIAQTGKYLYVTQPAPVDGTTDIISLRPPPGC